MGTEMNQILALTDFTGEWQLTRQIADNLTGKASQFKGRASFTQDGDQSVYHEVGRLMLAGAPPMTSERRYFWRQSNDQIDVFFDNDRPFHTIDFATSQSKHWCDPDQYDVRYAFQAWPMWTSEWWVKGPRKDYTLHSTYMKEGD
jgi:hypothetical protein